MTALGYYIEYHEGRFIPNIMLPDWFNALCPAKGTIIGDWWFTIWGIRQKQIIGLLCSWLKVIVFIPGFHNIWKKCWLGFREGRVEGMIEKGSCMSLPDRMGFWEFGALGKENGYLSLEIRFLLLLTLIVLLLWKILDTFLRQIGQFCLVFVNKMVLLSSELYTQSRSDGSNCEGMSIYNIVYIARSFHTDRAYHFNIVLLGLFHSILL